MTNLETAQKIKGLAEKRVADVMKALEADMAKFQKELDRLATDSEKQTVKAELNASVSDSEYERLDAEGYAIRELSEELDNWKDGLQ